MPAMTTDEYHVRRINLLRALHQGIIDEKELEDAVVVLDATRLLDNEIALLLSRGY